MQIQKVTKSEGSRTKSHWQYGYAKLARDADGNLTKQVFECQGRINPNSQTYRSTYLVNRTQNITTVMHMTFDFDFHRADEIWQKDGKLNALAAKNMLYEQYPEIAKFLLYVCESTSHTGYCLTFAISPFALELDTSKNPIKIFNLVRSWLFKIFTKHGMGCDAGALIGIKRLAMNPDNPEFLLWKNEILENLLLNNKDKRPPILGLMRDYLKSLPIIREELQGAKEKYRNANMNLLSVFPDARCRAKLEALILDLFDNDCSLYIAPKELRANYGLSRNFIYGTLVHGLEPIGLRVETQRGEWLLTLDVMSDAISLAYANQSRPKQSATPLPKGVLCEPEYVFSERYVWMGRALIALKHAGVQLDRARVIMEIMIKRVPGYKSSQNCRELETKLRSIYGSKPEMLGSNPSLAPDWLLFPESVPQSVEARADVGLQVCPLKCKKVIARAHSLYPPLSSLDQGSNNQSKNVQEGTNLRVVAEDGVQKNLPRIVSQEPYEDISGRFSELVDVKVLQNNAFTNSAQNPIIIEKLPESKTELNKLLRKVSMDGCILYDGNFYSVPETYLHAKVLVVKDHNQLKVFDSLKHNLITMHKIEPGRSKYIILPGHNREIGEREERYFDYFINRLAVDGPNVAMFARSLVIRYKIYAVRRIWNLISLVKKYEKMPVDAVCSWARNLGELRNYLEDECSSQMA